MTDSDINRKVHEAMGLCWHEWQRIPMRKSYKCTKCGITESWEKPKPPSYTTDPRLYVPLENEVFEKTRWILMYHPALPVIGSEMVYQFCKMEYGEISETMSQHKERGMNACLGYLKMKGVEVNG